MDVSDLDFALPSWGAPDPEPEPEPEPRAGVVASPSLQLTATSSRQETVADMRARLRRMEARARLRTSLSPALPSSPMGGLDESRITAAEGSPLHSLQRRAQLGGFDGKRGAEAADGTPVLGDRLLTGAGRATAARPATGGHPSGEGVGMAVERARQERRGRRRWLSDRLWHTASTTSAAALMGLDSATEAAVLRLRAAAAGDDIDAMQHAVDEADAVVAESYDRPHSVTQDGSFRGEDGSQGLAELTACLHEVKQRLETANRHRAMQQESEQMVSAIKSMPDGAYCAVFCAAFVLPVADSELTCPVVLSSLAVRWELTPDEADLPGGNGVAASALQARFVSLGWDDGDHQSSSPQIPHSPPRQPSPKVAAERSVSRGGAGGSRGDEI